MKRMSAFALMAGVTFAMGCGSGDSTLTRSELRARASAICAALTRDVQQAARETILSRDNSPQRVLRLRQQFIDRYQERLKRGAAELGELEPPAEMRSTYERFISNLDKVVELQTAIASNDRSAEATLTRIRSQQEQLTAELRISGCNF